MIQVTISFIIHLLIIFILNYIVKKTIFELLYEKIKAYQAYEEQENIKQKTYVDTIKNDIHTIEEKTISLWENIKQEYKENDSDETYIINNDSPQKNKNGVDTETIIKGKNNIQDILKKHIITIKKGT